MRSCRWRVHRFHNPPCNCGPANHIVCSKIVVHMGSRRFMLRYDAASRIAVCRLSEMARYEERKNLVFCRCISQV